jgi:hypothetical protein
MAAARTSFQRDADRPIVARMYLERRTIDEIARQIGRNRKTVMSDLRFLEAEWLRTSVTLTSARKAEELARIDRIELLAWEGYYRSMQIRKTSKAVIERDGGHRKTKAETRKEKLIGDPRWLDKVSWCVEQRAKILGLYAPTKSEGHVEHHHVVQTEFDREFARLVERVEGRGEGLSPGADEKLPRGFARPG